MKNENAKTKCGADDVENNSVKNILFKNLSRVCWLGFLLLVVSVLNPLSGNRVRNGAKREATREEMKMMTLLLDEYIKSNNRLPVDGNAAIISALSAIHTNDFYPLTPGPTSRMQTNSIGELVDYWQVPLQIQVVGTTNFIFRSAGPNKKFYDADDIIFNSVSNNFVKP